MDLLQPLVVVPAAPFAWVARVTERAFELPGVRVVERFVRRYPQGDLAAHLVGYLGKPSSRELREALDAGIVLDADRDLLGLLHTRGPRQLESTVRLRDEPYGRRGLERSRGNWAWPLAYAYALLGMLYFKLRANKRADDLACFGWQCVSVKQR